MPSRRVEHPRVLGRLESRKLDELAWVEHGLATATLMEQAGEAVACEVISLRPGVERVLVVSGTGANGGDGFVAARLLAQRGIRVSVATPLGPPREGPAAENFARLLRAGVAPFAAVPTKGFPDGLPEVVVDALLGTGLAGPPRSDAASAIDAINELRAQGARVLSVDCPSGLDVDSGTAFGVCVHADLTVTLAAFKAGFGVPEAREFLGRVVVADIGIPAALVERLGPPMETPGG